MEDYDEELWARDSRMNPTLRAGFGLTKKALGYTYVTPRFCFKQLNIGENELSESFSLYTRYQKQKSKGTEATARHRMICKRVRAMSQRWRLVEFLAMPLTMSVHVHLHPW